MYFFVVFFPRCCYFNLFVPYVSLKMSYLFLYQLSCLNTLFSASIFASLSLNWPLLSSLSHSLPCFLTRTDQRRVRVDSSTMRRNSYIWSLPPVQHHLVSNPRSSCTFSYSPPGRGFWLLDVKSVFSKLFFLQCYKFLPGKLSSLMSQFIP